MVDDTRTAIMFRKALITSISRSGLVIPTYLWWGCEAEHIQSSVWPGRTFMDKYENIPGRGTVPDD